ncbi:thermostable hemolysin [Streptosporangium sandarakinum]|uniref:thermostable hemolysin n=1 Tax=Streptosporangium sandarakinum TaxID=1260955 RepID=UPI0036CFE394
MATPGTASDSLSVSLPSLEEVRPGPGTPPLLRTGFASPGTPNYRFCVDSVKRKYLDRYGAVVTPCPDLFVTAWDGARDSPTSGRILGVAGLTTAAGRRLLSENYLDVPVERACADLVPGTHVDRRRVVEMGPIASFHPGAGLFLMRALPGIALHLGYDFLLSTLTEKLHDVARVAGWEFHTLTNARRADLAGTGGTDWGTYYSAKPRTGILRCGRDAAPRAAG